MTDFTTPTAPLAILGSGLCIPDGNVAAGLGFADAELDASILPPMVRRRTSNATRVAISAADRACTAAGTHRKLPAIFVSCAGEMQVTNKLCRAISQQNYPLSPTLFHNSVHNTAASYWSMATGSTAAMQAMGALSDGFALGLLEAWCQLQTVTERVLLVVYDEDMPVKLLPDYGWKNCAFALVLDRDAAANRPRLHQPFKRTAPDPALSTENFPGDNPAMAAAPLFQAVQESPRGRQQITLSPGTRPWLADLLIP
ncbi:MAG: beta-ketoacyl synthase chain length factor [Gammaproteobacteria bacterium]|nr:beta-ketoacyl synthase chain length factor [Gammaproteobacteria bacterium]